MKHCISTLLVMLTSLLMSDSVAAFCLTTITPDEAVEVDATQPEVAPRRRAADLVVLKDGRRVFGVFLRPPKSGEDHVLIVSSEWLSRALPDDWELIQRQWEGVTAGENQERLRQIAAFRTTLDEAGQLTQELEVFLEDAIAPPPERRDGGDTPRLIQLMIAPQLVQQVLVQPSSRRRLALIAMSNGLSSVETRDYLELSSEVRKNGLKPRNLPLPEPNGEAAVAEFERWKVFTRFEFFDQKRLVQYGETVYDRDAAVPMEALLAELHGRQTQLTIQELLDEASGRPPRNRRKSPATDDRNATEAARRKAEETGATTFLLQRLRISPQQFNGAVHLALCARDPGAKNWETIWATTVTVDPGTVTPDQQQELAEHPQLKELSGFLDQLGIDDAALGRSFVFGAAVQSAIEEADQQFLKERDRVLFQTRSGNAEIRAARLPEKLRH